MQADLNLNHIATQWPLLIEAHTASVRRAGLARGQILERYGGSIRRYLLGAVRDVDQAEELFQEFACRFLQGRMNGAAPERGRFRDFIKGVLSHLIADHHNRRKKQPTSLPAEFPEPAARSTSTLDRELAQDGRDALLARTWTALEAHERHTGRPLHTVLRFRADHPDLPSAAMARRLRVRLGKPLTDVGLRQLLHRARAKFAELLLREVALSSGHPAPDALHDELRELGLLDYCRSAL